MPEPVSVLDFLYITLTHCRKEKWIFIQDKRIVLRIGRVFFSTLACVFCII